VRNRPALKGNGLFPALDSVALLPPRIIGIAHDFACAFVEQKRLGAQERSLSRRLKRVFSPAEARRFAGLQGSKSRDRAAPAVAEHAAQPPGKVYLSQEDCPDWLDLDGYSFVKRRTQTEEYRDPITGKTQIRTEYFVTARLTRRTPPRHARHALPQRQLSHKHWDRHPTIWPARRRAAKARRKGVERLPAIRDVGLRATPIALASGQTSRFAKFPGTNAGFVLERRFTPTPTSFWNARFTPTPTSFWNARFTPQQEADASAIGLSKDRIVRVTRKYRSGNLVAPFGNKHLVRKLNSPSPRFAMNTSFRSRGALHSPTKQAAPLFPQSLIFVMCTSKSASGSSPRSVNTL
jgi:hypothetical protein